MDTFICGNCGNEVGEDELCPCYHIIIDELAQRGEDILKARGINLADLVKDDSL